MRVGVAAICGFGNDSRFHVQWHQQDMDITAGWQMDMFLDTGSLDNVISVPLFTDVGGLGIWYGHVGT